MEENCVFLDGSETAKLIKNKQWQSESNFPVTNWPDTLKVAVTICMNSAFPIGILWGPEFIFYYNDAYIKILGDKHPGSLGKPMYEVYPDIWQEIGPQFRQVHDFGETIKHPDMPFLLNRKRYSEECYFDYMLSPIYIPEGSVGGMFNVVVETTEKKIIERRNQLLDNLVKHQTNTQSLSACISGCHDILDEAIQDIPFYFIYLQQMDGSYKLTSDVGIGQASGHINWPVDALLEKGTIVHVEHLSDFLSEPMIRHFPEPCTEAVILQIKNSAPVSSGYMVAGLSPRKRFDAAYERFLRSVTAKIARCFESARSFDDYQELANEKDNLLAIISHELKTPITTIKAYAQLAARGLLQDNHTQPAQFIHKLNGQAAKLDFIVSEIVDSTKFRAGKIPIRKAEFDFDHMVRDQINAAKKDGASHFFVTELNVGVPISGDQKRLRQVVEHLISNATLYSPVNSRIEITTGVRDRQLFFSIRDYGLGIKSEEHEKVFDRFYRSVDLKQYAVPGIGLGLFIAREIIKLSGGQIWLDSKLNEGSTFHFRLDM